MRTSKPVVVSNNIQVKCEEMMFYQYLPIKPIHSSIAPNSYIPNRLVCFLDLIHICVGDFIMKYGADAYEGSYIYLTAKHLWQGPGSSFNRPGYHIDGYLTSDVNYVWCDKSPTIFNSTDFNLSEDDVLSLKEMEEQADPSLEYTLGVNKLIRINSRTVHRVSVPQVAELRTFFKLSFSEDKYNLIGNSRNWINSTWKFHERNATRNQPAKEI